MKNSTIFTALLLATGLLTAACVADPDATASDEGLGSEQELVSEEGAAEDTDSEAAATVDQAVVIEKPVIASAVPPPCKETYTCEACASGKRTKQTYYAKDELLCDATGVCWRICSDLRTVYGSCGSCFQ